MSHVWQLEASALGQVALAALVLGAGLPALFALGVRASALGRGPDGTGAPSTAGRALSVLVYAAVVLVALAGIVLIVASGFGKAVSFENVYPMVVDK